MRICGYRRENLSAWPMFGAGTPLKLRTRASKSDPNPLFTYRNRPPNHDFEGFQEIDLGEIWERKTPARAQTRSPGGVQKTSKRRQETSKRRPRDLQGPQKISRPSRRRAKTASQQSSQQSPQQRPQQSPPQVPSKDHAYIPPSFGS